MSGAGHVPVRGSNGSGVGWGGAGRGAGTGGGLASPEFLLQLVKLLKRKEELVQQIKGQNDALLAARARGASPSEEMTLKKEYAWNNMQLERINEKLRGALWGVALGMGQGDGDAEAASARDSELTVGSDGTIPIVRQCGDSATSLVQASMSKGGLLGGDVEDDAAGHAQPFVGGCVGLLMLLRRCEEQAMLASEHETRSADASAKWDKVFEAALSSIRPSDKDGEAAFNQVQANIATLKSTMFQ